MRGWLRGRNILLGKTGEVKVADYGVARANERISRTATGIVKGKTGYLAPEQVLGEESDHRLDQFATGIVLWEMLVGRRLFRAGNELAQMEMIERSEIPAPSTLCDDVPATVDELVLRAMARQPKERFADMAALDAAIGECLFSRVRRPSDVDVRPVVAAALEPEEATTPIHRGLPDLDAPTVDDGQRPDFDNTHSDVFTSGGAAALDKLVSSIASMRPTITERPVAPRAREAPAAPRRRGRAAHAARRTRAGRRSQGRSARRMRRR